MLSGAVGAAWILITLFTGMGLTKLVVEGHLEDCEKLGKFRYGEIVIECKVVKP